VKDATDATFKEMFEILSAPLPTERIKHRKNVAIAYEARRSFVQLDKNKKRRQKRVIEKNPNVYFQHLEYKIGQGRDFCTVVVSKRVATDYSFWITTKDGEAKAPVDFTAIHELITMKAHEKERQIQI
jgi:hypothetical protein